MSAFNNNYFPDHAFMQQGTSPGQGSDPQQFDSCVSEILKMDYQPLEMRGGWAEALSNAPAGLDKTDFKKRIRFTTEMVGVAGKVMNDRDYKVPTASWRQADMTLHGYCKLGIQASWYPDEEQYNKWDKTADKVIGLNRIIEFAEDDFIAWYFINNTVGGWQNKALFAHDHGIIGNPAYCVSNILDAGPPSQTLISELDDYGMDFRSHEGFLSPRRPVLIITSMSNARRWEIEYAMEGNTSPNKPRIVGVGNIPNRTVSYVFYEGYANSFFLDVEYKNKSEMGETQFPTMKKVYKWWKGRVFHVDPRLVVRTGGA